VLSLDQMAEAQGIYGPTDLDKLFGALEGSIDDDFLAAIREIRNSQDATRK